MFDTPVPLEIIENGLKASGRKVQRNGTCIRMSGSLGETIVEAKPVGVGTVDGEEVSDILTVRTDLPSSVDSLNDQMILGLNAYAGIRAVMRDPRSNTLFSGSRLHIPLILYSAHLQSDLLVREIGSFTGAEGPQGVDLPESGDPSRWDEEEFDYAASFLTGRGFLCTADDTGLAVEFPMGAPSRGKSAVLGHELPQVARRQSR